DAAVASCGIACGAFAAAAVALPGLTLLIRRLGPDGARRRVLPIGAGVVAAVAVVQALRVAGAM
ncbi:MAG: hypothetical protein KIT31_27605, partial [Deltaproteobacteria bacterium]|nr:hypothetical protein [Deltaproteobacteria bacterium]